MNKFIFGTNDSTAVGETGGVSSHLHRMQFTLNNSTSLITQTTVLGERIVVEELNTGTGYPARHRHEIDIEFDGATSRTGNLPPFYRVIYIIKYK